MTNIRRISAPLGIVALLASTAALAQPAPSPQPAAADPAQPMIAALAEASATMRAAPYARGPAEAALFTEKYLAGLTMQAWNYAEHLNMLATPYFSRATGIEGLPGLYNPDNIYRSALLDPAGSYRIYGRRGSHTELTFQVIDQYPVVALGKNLSVIRPEVRPGRDFEFYLGGPRRPGGNWYPLPDKAAAVLSRQTFADWRQSPSTLQIERLDQPAPRPYQSPFASAAVALRAQVKLWVERFVPGLESATPLNTMRPPRDTNGGQGGLGGQMSVMARYALAPDQALVITVAKSDALYQGIQLGDRWFVTPNSVDHQVSLNLAQARADRDGKLRFVIALSDPGVPNWLDPAGDPAGYVFMRWQGVKTRIEGALAPTAQLVPLAGLRKVLPPDTPVVDAAARRAQLAERKWVPQIR